MLTTSYKTQPLHLPSFELSVWSRKEHCRSRPLKLTQSKKKFAGNREERSRLEADLCYVGSHSH
jgi:hypothetical protein